MINNEVDKLGDEPPEPIFMTLIKNDDQACAHPDMSLKIEPVFEQDYKPGIEMGAPKKLVNVMQQRNCFATSLAVHERIIAVGSSTGLVILSDPLGNVDHKNNVFHNHARSTVALDIDSSGEFVVSGGEDGRVVVLDLGASDQKDSQLIQLTHQRPVKAVALDPEFYRAKERRILVACGGRVILYVSKKASLFSSSEPQVTVLVDNIISILRLAWQPPTNNGASPLIAWANERGEIVLYDEKRKINAGLIRPEAAQVIAATANTNKVSATFSQISLSWLPQMDSSGSSSILVVCGSLLRIFLVTGGDDPRGSETVSPRVVQCTHRFALEAEIAVDSVLASIGSVSNPSFAACCLSTTPYQLILCPLGNGKPTSLPLLNYPLPNNDQELISMASLPFDGHTYALYKNGTLYAVKLSPVNEDILTDYVDYLLKNGDASGAAALLPLIFDNKKQVAPPNKYKMTKISWDDWLAKFDQLGQIPAVAAYLPITKPQPNSEVHYPSKERYNMVLNRVLAQNPGQFESLIARISPELYSLDVAMRLVSEALVLDPRNASLLASLAFMCCSKQEFERAVNILLELKHDSLFKIITDNNLYFLVQKRVAELAACSDKNPDVVVKLLVTHLDKFPPSSVISQLKSSSQSKTGRSSQSTLFAYLERMFIDRPDDLQQSDVDLLVSLYADIDPDHLLTFLRSTDLYRLENALAECRKRNRPRECVFLLGKGGKMVEAMDVIIKELGSIAEAVEFCREKGGSSNRDLWMVLADRVANNRPDLVADLLRLTGTELLDPAEVIKLIPTASGRLVPGLRQALEGSLSDSERQLNVLSSARIVVGNDLNQVFKQMKTSTFSATVVVDERSPCQECHEPLSNARSSSMRLIVFTCRHAFHYACLPGADEANCPVCGRLNERSTAMMHAAGGGGGGNVDKSNIPYSTNESDGGFIASITSSFNATTAPSRIPQSHSGPSTPHSSLPFSSLLSGLTKTAVR